MSTRQIRRIRQYLNEEERREQTPPRVSPVQQVHRDGSCFVRYMNYMGHLKESEEEASEEESSDESETENNTPSLETFRRNSPHLAKNNKKQRENKKGDIGLITDSEEELEHLLQECLSLQAQKEERSGAASKNFDFLKIEPRNFRLSAIPTVSGGRKRWVRGNRPFQKVKNWLLPGARPISTQRLTEEVTEQLKLVGTLDHQTGRERFVFTKSARYKELEALIVGAIETHDPGLLRQMFQTNNHHVELLLRVSTIYTLQGQHEDAFKLISVAIHLINLYIPIRFTPFRQNEAGYFNTWLPSDVPENLVMYKLLLLYMISLERQAEWEVSLAVAKLLLQMDYPNDTAHALLHIDFYLLHTMGKKLHNFSIGYAREMEYGYPLHWVLPNFAFSLSLDHFQKEQCAFMTAPLRPQEMETLMEFLCMEEDTFGFQLRPERDNVENFPDYRAQMSLIRALVQYPRMIEVLSREYNATQLDYYVGLEPFSDWIASDESAENTSLINFYLKKSSDLWKNESLSFLCQTANIVVQLFTSQRGALILDSYRNLWQAMRAEIPLPFSLEGIIASEFDISSHSLPMHMQ